MRAAGSAWTLKPMTMAWEATANIISDSVMLPVAWRMNFTFNSSVLSFSRDSLTGSMAPWTSTLRIMFSSFTFPAWIRAYRSSRLTRLGGVGAAWRLSSARLAAKARALLSSGTTSKGSPARGTAGSPKTATGVDGPALLTRLHSSSNIALTLP